MTKYEPLLDDDDMFPVLIQPRSRKKNEHKAKTPKLTDEEKVNIKKEQIFDSSIQHIVRTEGRQEWREAIESTQCFARLWFDEDEESFCDQIECSLRDFCQKTWEQGMIALENDASVVTNSDPLYKYHKKRSPRVSPTKKRKVMGRPRSCKFVHNTSNVSASERPSYKLAVAMSLMFKNMKETPANTMRVSKNKDNKNMDAMRQVLLKKIGNKPYVARRKLYHVFIVNGYFICRMNLTAANGGWLDLAKCVVKSFLRVGVEVSDNNQKGKACFMKNRFFPYRAYFSYDKESLRFLFNAFRDSAITSPWLINIKES